MCGIAGIYGQKDNNLLNTLSKNLIHRGPDDEGRYLDEDLSMVIRRLSIIDISKGSQPKFNEDKSIIVTFNGEIYNYRELSKKLKNLGHQIVTNSDTEIIAHAYEEWDIKAFDMFDGMFAIALYDKKKKTLLLARDHFGIKPLYYVITKTKKNQTVAYSSEIKPLLYSGLAKAIPDDRIIYRYLKYRIHDDNRGTFFKGIKRLMPGEVMFINKNNIKIKKYTDILNTLKTNTTGNRANINIIDGFKILLNKSIQNRLISDVPVGTCLSGGLDSSTIVSVISNLITNKKKEAKSVGPRQNVFSAVFPGYVNDEEKYVDILTKNLPNIKVHKIYPSHKEFLADIKDFVKTQEEPTISSGPYAQYKVLQEASKHVKVVLDGQGADEILAGYNPYYLVYFRQLLKEKKYLRLFIEVLSSLDIIYKIIKQTTKKKNLDLINNEFELKFKKEFFNPTKNNLKKRLIEDTFFNSLPALLRYEDKNSMRFSIEGRVPFCDINLIKYIFSQEDKFIINYGWNKNILRSSAKSLLPDIIRLRRNKIGFTTPEYDWFHKNYDYIYKIFTSRDFGQRKYFNQVNAVLALKKFKVGKFNDTLYIWRLLNLELWLREFIDPTSSGTVRYLTTEGKKKKRGFRPNYGKRLEIKVDGKMYYRFPIKTDLFKKGDDYITLINNYVTKFIKGLSQEKKYKNILTNKFFVVVSEKIVAIAQSRSYFIWDIKQSLFANVLSKFVTKTPYGIGLGSPWTMQLAINEVGLPRILLATLVSVVTKPLGIKGMFYNVLGSVVRSIDGPTKYSLYPSNVSAKLGPEKPNLIAERIKSEIRNSKSEINSKFKILNSKFLGVVIIDANDLGQNVLGNSTGLTNQLIERIFKDNPMGQTDEQTPISLVFL